MDLTYSIRTLAENLLPEPNLYIVDVQVKGNPQTSLKVTVLADGDEGIGIDEIVELSRKLGAAIEEQNLIDAAWNLEVSSPGVDMPLTDERQYRKNLNRQLRVELKGGAVAEGRLAELVPGGFMLEPKSTRKKPHPKSPEAQKLLEQGPELRHIAFADVEKAVVQVQF